MTKPMKFFLALNQKIRSNSVNPHQDNRWGIEVQR